MLEVGPNSKSQGNHVVRSEKRKRKGAVRRICRKKVYTDSGEELLQSDERRCAKVTITSHSATIDTLSLSSVLFQALGPYTHKTHNTHTKRT